eukprot:g66922.t1
MASSSITELSLKLEVGGSSINTVTEVAGRWNKSRIIGDHVLELWRHGQSIMMMMTFRRSDPRCSLWKKSNLPEEDVVDVNFILK